MAHKAKTTKARLRPQFEIDPVMNEALRLYMRDEEVRHKSSVMRKALKQFLPVKYQDAARRVVARSSRKTAAVAA